MRRLSGVKLLPFWKQPLADDCVLRLSRTASVCSCSLCSADVRLQSLEIRQERIWNAVWKAVSGFAGSTALSACRNGTSLLRLIVVVDDASNDLLNIRQR